MPQRWSHLEAVQVGHCLNMVAEMPLLIADDRLPTSAHVACTESFFSNMRALVEFLVLDAAAGRIHRSDYHLTWSPEQSEQSSELRRVYGLASEQVSHLMKKRVKNATEPHVRVDAEGLRALADLTFVEFDQFVEALRGEDPEAALLFEGFLIGARQRQGSSPGSA